MAITDPAGRLWKRLAWMVGIWAASVAGLGVVAESLRLILKPLLR